MQLILRRLMFLIQLGLLSCSPVIYAQEALEITEEELIFPLQNLHVHGSSIVALPDGDLLTAWFEGSGERTADDVRIRGSRKQKDSREWSAPFDLADTPGIPDCNPVLFLNQENRLFLVWIAVQANRWENSILRYRTATDFDDAGPPVWEWQDNILLKPGDDFAVQVRQKMEQLPDQEAGWAAYAPPYDRQIIDASTNPTYRSLGWMTRIPPLLFPDGRILLPLYSDGLNFSLMAISDDQGQTWRPSQPLVGRGPIQPSLIQRKDGSIIAYMRDSGDAPSRVQISYSTDLGESWTVATKTDIPNTASVSTLKLHDGRWILVGNMMEDGRNQLMLWVSGDEGATWTLKHFLENDRPEAGRYSYPCVIQTHDGQVHITYSYHKEEQKKSIKYVKIDPGRL